jgi:hypothetical protein
MQFDWLGGRLAAVMRADPTAEGLDWTSLRDDLGLRGLLPAGTVAAAFNWRDAGKIGRGLGPGATMLCLSSDARQFGFANPLRAFAGQDVLLLLVLGPVDKAGVDKAVAKATPWFRAVEVLPNASVRIDGRVLRTVTVLRGLGLRP